MKAKSTQWVSGSLETVSKVVVFSSVYPEGSIRVCMRGEARCPDPSAGVLDEVLPVLCKSGAASMCFPPTGQREGTSKVLDKG